MPSTDWWESYDSQGRAMFLDRPDNGLAAEFLGNGDLAVSPGQTLSWRIKVTVNGEPFAGAVITPEATPYGVLAIANPLPTAVDGTVTISASVIDDVAANTPVAVVFAISAADLLMNLYSTVTVVDSPYGYVLVRGRKYPRPYPQNT